MSNCDADALAPVTAEGASPTEHYTFLWRGRELRVAYDRHAFGRPRKLLHVSHLQIETRGVLPVTETGYRSHFLPGGEIEAAGGVVVYVTQWLDHAARKPEWKAIERDQRQGSLF